jgi:hypothetical protein
MRDNAVEVIRMVAMLEMIYNRGENAERQERNSMVIKEFEKPEEEAVSELLLQPN